jgi:short subunit dehydrogenase-like uncharacterized protein
MNQREFDVVLYGASGFTGRQTVGYFHRHAPSNLRWAVGGRNREKLQRVIDEHAPGQNLEIIEADGRERSEVDEICRRARIVLTTAGPFSRYGRHLADSCVAHRTHYVDITGETTYVADLISAHHETALANGTRIIPFCGFDSIPSDLGVWLAADYFRQRGQTLGSVVSAFKLRGGLNGGTMATALAMAEDGEQSRINDVLLLNPSGHHDEQERIESADLVGPLKHDHFGWLTPFVMAPINTRVVRRTNGLLSDMSQGYGPHFRYREAFQAKSRFGAQVFSRSIATIDWLIGYGWGRRVLARLTPSPGEGPSQEVMDSGFFSARFYAESTVGSAIEVKIFSAGDPGNRVTVTALCESALCLALDEERLAVEALPGGILTPMTGLGRPLKDRLLKAGWSMEVTPIHD